MRKRALEAKSTIWAGHGGWTGRQRGRAAQRRVRRAGRAAEQRRAHRGHLARDLDDGARHVRDGRAAGDEGERHLMTTTTTTTTTRARARKRRALARDRRPLSRRAPCRKARKFTKREQNGDTRTVSQERGKTPREAKKPSAHSRRGLRVLPDAAESRTRFRLHSPRQRSANASR